ncbi:MAG: Na/Pi cotransporter family protein [Nanoarchaeota archaeon]|nr:Na/Pi cotransporter family protein [Nanoarchaeota archaeon]
MLETIFGIFGGLGLFIFGIFVMGEALQKLAGDKIRTILNKLTNKGWMGVAVGACVTSIMQSSSATTVLVVGFVSAGLMTLTQAVGVILGANIGTTITGQLIAFKLTKYALPILGVGSFIFLFSKRKKIKHFGESIFGFGVLFLGLSIMSTAVKPLGSSIFVQDLFINFSHNPLLGILVGMLITALVQSSSVTIGLVITLGLSDLITLGAAIPLILGDNIGTCITAGLASIRANISAKRAAAIHIMFNVIGAGIALLMLPLYLKVILYSSTDIARQIANAHTIFNVVNAFIFLPFIPLFVLLVKKIVPGKDIEITRGPKYIEKNLLRTPSIAFSATLKEMRRMARITKEMINDAMEGFYKNKRGPLEKVAPKEQVVDDLQTAISNYLVELTQKELSEDQSERIPALLHSVNDIERIGDHAENFAEFAERKIDEKLVFSEHAIKEIKQMHKKINDMLTITITALKTEDIKDAKKIIKIEKEINSLTIEFRNRHITRVKEGKCKVLSGIIFLDMIMNFEKIGDHLNNIAQVVKGKMKVKRFEEDMIL